MKSGKIETMLQKTVVVWLGAMISCALWGSAFPCIKLGYQWTGIASDSAETQILFAGMRFTLAGVLTVLLGSLMKRTLLYPTKKALPKVAWLSVLQTILQYLFFYIGLAHTSGVKASIIEGVNVFVAVLVSAMVFRLEKLTWKKLLGCAIGFCGVVLVNLPGSGQGLDLGLAWNGEGFIFLSTVAYAFSSVFMKYYSKEYDPVMLSGYQFVIGGLVMMLAGFLLGGRVVFPDTRSVLMLLYLAFLSAVAYSIWGILLKYNPVSRVAVFGFMNPVFGVLLSALLLEEANAVGFSALAALVLVCIGIFIVNGKQKQTDTDKVTEV